MARPHPGSTAPAAVVPDRRRLPMQATGSRPTLVAAASSGEGGLAGAPAGWELATRVSGDALAMMGEGDVAAAEIILKKGGGPACCCCPVQAGVASCRSDRRDLGWVVGLRAPQSAAVVAHERRESQLLDTLDQQPARCRTNVHSWCSCCILLRRHGRDRGAAPQ